MCAPAPQPPTPFYTERSAYRVSALSLGLTVGAVVAGLIITAFTRSSATLGYALENLVDTVGSVLILWRFDTSLSAATLELREKRSSLGISLMLVVLGLTVGCAASTHLLHRDEIHGEAALLALSLPSFLGFGALGAAKWRIAAAIDSPALKKDAVCSLSGAVLSLGVLLSYVLHELARVWWADAVIAVVVGAGLAAYGAASLVRNRALRWWTARFWSEGASREATKRAARAAMAGLEAPASPHNML